MNTKTFFIRLAGLVVIAALHFVLYAVTINALLYFQFIPAELVDKAFGSILTMKAVYVWFGCLLLGFASLFIKENWRLVLYFSPLYAPSLFAILYTLIQQ